MTALKMIDLSDIPENMNEAEEHEFWKTHTLSESVPLYRRDEADAPLPPPRPRVVSRNTSIRLDDDLTKRLKAMARRKGKGYQTLLKEFVSERLYEEEKREGVI